MDWLVITSTLSKKRCPHVIHHCNQPSPLPPSSSPSPLSQSPLPLARSTLRDPDTRKSMVNSGKRSVYLKAAYAVQRNDSRDTADSHKRQRRWHYEEHKHNPTMQRQNCPIEKRCSEIDNHRILIVDLGHSDIPSGVDETEIMEWETLAAPAQA